MLRKTSRTKRLRQIVRFVLSQPEPVTISEVARGVGLRVTPYTRDLLAWLVDEGILEFQMVRMPNGTEGRVYSATPLAARFLE